MRMNVYAEELTDRIEIIRRVPSTGHTDQEFIGLRIYLKSPPELHTDPEDDDTSAITFWFASFSAAQVFAEKTTRTIRSYAEAAGLVATIAERTREVLRHD